MKTERGFFEEAQVPFATPGERYLFPVRATLYEGQSQYQKIQVLDLEGLGRTLVLDGVIQTCERDCFRYGEMIVHPALMSHPNPKNVLIIGGGDGETLKEVLKHPSVKKAVQIELDEQVTTVCREYLPTIHGGALYDSDRVELIHRDGVAYIADPDAPMFDIIINDLSDPDSSDSPLISAGFYKNERKKLRPGGILSVQAGSFKQQPELPKLVITNLKAAGFEYLEVRAVNIPMYQGGEFAFILASTDVYFRLENPDTRDRQQVRGIDDLKMWSARFHHSSTVLPPFMQQLLE